MNSIRMYCACWKAIRITPNRDKLGREQCRALLCGSEQHHEDPPQPGTRGYACSPNCSEAEAGGLFESGVGGIMRLPQKQSRAKLKDFSLLQNSGEWMVENSCTNGVTFY